MLWAHIIKKEATALFDYLILYQYFVHLLHLLFLKQFFFFHTDTERMSSSACLYYLFFRQCTSLRAFAHFPICSSFDLTCSSMVHLSGSYMHTVQVTMPPLSSPLEGLPLPASLSYPHCPGLLIDPLLCMVHFHSLLHYLACTYAYNLSFSPQKHKFYWHRHYLYLCGFCLLLYLLLLEQILTQNWNSFIQGETLLLYLVYRGGNFGSVMLNR